MADLCNHLRKKRQHMIDEALRRGMQVVLVYFDIPEDIRLARMYNRLHDKEPHPSVNDEATALKVHQYFQREFQPPTADEWAHCPPRAVIPIRITAEEEVGKHLLTFNSRQ